MDLVHLPVGEDYVYGHEDAHPELVGIGAQAGNLPDGIACVLARAECRPGDIDGIGTAVNRRDADICRSCRSKKFE